MVKEKKLKIRENKNIKKQLKEGNGLIGNKNQMQLKLLISDTTKLFPK